MPESNSKRLSAMIDSLQKGPSDENLISGPASPEPYVMGKDDGKTPFIQSPLLQPPVIPSPTHTYESPKLADAPRNNALTRSPAGNVSLYSPGNRSSMLSQYSGVIDTGVEVSYVVENAPRPVVSAASDSTITSKVPKLPSLPTLPSQDNVIIQSVPNARPVGRFNSKKSTQSTDGSSEPRPKSSGSLKLLNKPRGSALSSSIGSGNLGSVSGTSDYQHADIDGRLDFNKSSESSYKARDKANETDDDHTSTASSIIPSLQTQVNKGEREIKSYRSETTSYNPIIPPRNKNRPTSMLSLENPEKVITNLPSMPPPKIEISANKRSSTTTNHSDAYFSANSVHSEEIDQQKDFSEDESYVNRSLPITPPENDDTIQAITNPEEYAKYEIGEHGKDKGTANLKIEQNGINNDDDEYEDVVEEVRDNRNTNDGRSTTKKEIRSFDNETIAELLNMTKGTLIGSEFANLGMQVEEKRLLERLVDSLSRLTADMILDPDRYHEGLKRLKKAIKALEGF